MVFLSRKKKPLALSSCFNADIQIQIDQNCIHEDWPSRGKRRVPNAFQPILVKRVRSGGQLRISRTPSVPSALRSLHTPDTMQPTSPIKSSVLGPPRVHAPPISLRRRTCRGDHRRLRPWPHPPAAPWPPTHARRPLPAVASPRTSPALRSPRAHPIPRVVPLPPREPAARPPPTSSF